MKTDLQEVFEIQSGNGAGEDLLRHERVLCYKTRTIRCGEITEVEAFPVYLHAFPDGQRMKERIRSSAAQRKVNDRRAENRFRRKAEANFSRGDLFLTLTYEGVAPDMRQAERDFRNFIRRVNRARAKKGIPAARYMGVLEAGNKSGRAHHHVIISGGLSRDELEGIWQKGFANCDRLQLQTGGLKGLCRYMLKSAGSQAREKDRKRWTCSRNLVEPRVTESTHRITKRQAAKLAEDAQLMGEEVLRKVYPGMELLELEVRRSDWIAGAYITARLRRPYAE